MSFKKGQMVKHPNIDEPIRVKASNEVCTVVERINEPMHPSKNPDHYGRLIYPVYIVITNNLTELSEPQLNLFK